MDQKPEKGWKVSWSKYYNKNKKRSSEKKHRIIISRENFHNFEIVISAGITQTIF